MARVAGHRRRPGAPAPAPVPTTGTAGAGAEARPHDGPPARPHGGPPARPHGGPPARPHDGPPARPHDDDLLVVGRIGKPQGIRGEVTVQVRTDDPDTRFAPGAVLHTDPAERGPVTVAAARWQNGRLVVAFEGVPDRSAAEGLRETLLQVDARTLPPPEDEDEFHDHVLRGMAVELVDGAELGTVADVLHLPHGDVLVVRRTDTGGEVLVPFVKAMVPVVDVAGRRLQVDPPEGLLDVDAAR